MPQHIQNQALPLILPGLKRQDLATKEDSPIWARAPPLEAIKPKELPKLARETKHPKLFASLWTTQSVTSQQIVKIPWEIKDGMQV